MKTTKMLTILVLALCLLVCSVQFASAGQMGTAFTYQGHLYDANYVANGIYDFQFKLYDANSDGNQIGSDVNRPNIDVIDAYFTVELDFGGDVFDGNSVWLEIGVRPGDLNDTNVYTTLSPRQEVTPAPYAIYAKTTGSVPSKGNATLVVAASNAPASVKLAADYVCDGTADQVEINAAIAALQTDTGGIVHLSAGQFLVNAPIQINTGETITLEGEGIAHYNDLATEIKLAGGSNCNVIELAGTGDGSSIYHTFRNFCVHGNYPQNSSGIGIKANPYAGDMTFYNLAIVQCYEHGMYLDGCNNHVFNCWFEHNVGNGIMLYGASRPIVHQCFFSDNNFGIRIDANIKDPIITSNIIWFSKSNGIFIRNATHGVISNNIVCSSSQLADNSFSQIEIELNCTYLTVTGNVCGIIDAPKQPKSGIRIDALANYCNISNNNLEGYDTIGIDIDSGANANGIIRNNHGFMTENSGTATLVNGTTSIAVNHGLDVAPSAGDIMVVPIEAWGNMTKFWIGNYTSTQFTIYADQSPGQDVDFAWSAAVY